MRRRDVLIATASMVVTLPTVGQTPRAKRVGIFIVRREGDPEGSLHYQTIIQALARRGWKIGDNLEVDVQWLPTDEADAKVRIEEVLAKHPQLIVANGSFYLRAVVQVATTVPVVFIAVGDPVGSGFVDKLASPGGRMTGFAAEDSGLGAKWPELLKEAAPAVKRLITIYNDATAANPKMFLSAVRLTAQNLSLEVQIRTVESRAAILSVFADAAATPDAGILVLPDPFLYDVRQLISAAATAHGLPTICYHRAFAEAGALLSYGIDRTDLFRRAAGYVDLLLKGANPGELPVQMPERFELAVNSKTAKALGLAIPPSILVRADEVIE